MIAPARDYHAPIASVSEPAMSRCPSQRPVATWQSRALAAWLLLTAAAATAIWLFA